MLYSKRIISALLFVLTVVVSSSLTFALDYPQLKPKPEPAAEKKTATVELPTNRNFLDKAIDPKNYIIGPGDVFLINLLGMAQEPIFVEVLPEGIVSIPQIGEINLGAVTLEQAKQKIMDGVMSRYRDKAITVSLARLRSFKVSVTGAVEKPSVVVVSASDRVSEALALAGGLQHKGSKRNIKLASDKHDTLVADIDMFNATGKMEANPYLHEGQVIFVPVVSDSFDKVEIYGAVNAPGVFEFKPGDRVSDLIALGFGVATDADTDDGELVRFAPNSAITVTVKIDLKAIMSDKSSAANIALQSDDRLFIRTLASFRSKEQVTIRGEVKYPGVYPIQDGSRTLSELVAKAGGLMSGASLSEAEMYRKSQTISGEEQTSFDRLLQLSTDKLTDFELQYLKETSGKKQGKVAVDFDLLLGHHELEHDVPLMDGDLVNIPQKSYAVSVIGRVVNPGLVPFKDNQTVDYYVRLAGGYGYKADKGDVRIIKANSGAVVKSDRETPVAMGDRIMVPQKKGAEVWKFVKDAGFFLANLATVYVVIHQATQ